MPRVVPGYREEARKRILGSALQVFAEKGYTRSTMDDIAQAVGVSKGALYLYFESKEELYRQLCRVETAALSAQLREAFRGGDIVEGARRYFESYIEGTSMHTGFDFELVSEATRDESIRAVLRATLRDAIETVSRFLEEKRGEGVLKKDVDVRALAASFVALHRGVTELLAAGLGQEEVKGYWVGFVKAILSGIATDGR